MIGMGYLIKSLYNLVPSIWGTGSVSIAAGGCSFPSNLHGCLRGPKSRSLTSFSHLVVVSDAIDLEDIVSDAAVAVPDNLGTNLDPEANFTIDVHPPQPSYDPQNHAERSQAHSRAQNQSSEVFAIPTATHATPEQDVGVRNEDPYIEEGMDIAIGWTG